MLSRACAAAPRRGPGATTTSPLAREAPPRRRWRMRAAGYAFGCCVGGRMDMPARRAHAAGPTEALRPGPVPPKTILQLAAQLPMAPTTPPQGRYDDRVPCASCGRMFAADRIDTHARICQKNAKVGLPGVAVFGCPSFCPPMHFHTADVFFFKDVNFHGFCFLLMHIFLFSFVLCYCKLLPFFRFLSVLECVEGSF